MSERNEISIHVLVLKVLSLGKHILLQQKNKLVSLLFISHSKLHNDKNMLLDFRIKVKQVHGAECYVVFWFCFLSFDHF